MTSVPFFLVPLALLLPFGIQTVPVGGIDEERQVAHQSRDGERQAATLPLSQDAPAWSPIFEGVGPSSAEQVRIERRVILRITPAPGPARQSLMSEPARLPARTRVVERAVGKCIDSAEIGGVADRGDRLLVFMRDRRMIAAQLEKGCSARDFYRGFYMERSDDGKLCVKRDRLMSRSGAKCQIEGFRELVVEPLD